jgi:hypothetical protein
MLMAGSSVRGRARLSCDAPEVWADDAQAGQHEQEWPAGLQHRARVVDVLGDVRRTSTIALASRVTSLPGVVPGQAGCIAAPGLEAEGRPVNIRPTRAAGLRRAHGAAVRGGLRQDGKPDFWISDRPTSAPLHVAFASPNRTTFDRGDRI